MSTPREPGLDRLIMALTTDGHPSELAGRDAALAAFRAASQSPRRTPRRSPFGRMPARLAAVVAAGAAALAGVTAAAYAQALPAPVQQIAHTVFAVVGVPDSQPQPATSGHPQRTASATGQGSTPQGAGCPCPATTSATPSPTAAGHFTLTVSAARVHVPAYAVDVFTGRITQHGHAAAGIRVRLLVRPAGATAWRLAASGKTGPHGGFRLPTPRLTTTAAFRVSGPGGSQSTRVTVTVGARVRLKLVPGNVNDHLIVIARAARPGDTAVLEKLVAGSWTRVARRPLGAAYQASFSVPAKTAAAHTYRGEVLIAGSPVPGAAVWVPRAKHTTGATIIGGPSPSTSPTATPTVTSMPSPTTTVTVQPTPTDSTSPAPTSSAPPGATPTPTGPSSPSSAPAPTGSAAPTGSGSPAPSTTSSSASQSARFL